MPRLMQDIRPLKVLILNLMPDKIRTETQLLRVLGASPLQIDITLIHPATRQSKIHPLSISLAFIKRTPLSKTSALMP